MSLIKQFLELYDKKYKQLLIIPIILLVVSVGILVNHYSRTGEWFSKDVSLKGGTTITVETQKAVDIVELEKFLRAELKNDGISVRMLNVGGRQTGIIIDADINTPEEINNTQQLVASHIGVPFSDKTYTTQQMGSSLGASFFREAFIVIGLAFVLMGLVVLIYFRNLVPSLFVIWCAFCDIFMPFAAIVLLDVKLSTAGMAAFLMLIGYSVDTDILLTTRVLKQKEGTIFERTVGAMKTGLTMTVAALAATTVSYFFAQSEVIKQIMLILSIGLVFDVINTWITNAGILRWYLEHRKK